MLQEAGSWRVPACGWAVMVGVSIPLLGFVRGALAAESSRHAPCLDWSRRLGRGEGALGVACGRRGQGGRPYDHCPWGGIQVERLVAGGEGRGHLHVAPANAAICGCLPLQAVQLLGDSVGGGGGLRGEGQVGGRGDCVARGGGWEVGVVGTGGGGGGGGLGVGVRGEGEGRVLVTVGGVIRRAEEAGGCETEVMMHGVVSLRRWCPPQAPRKTSASFG